MDELELTKKRLLELGKKSYDAGYFIFTDFLGLAEQSLFLEIKPQLKGVKYTAFGGTEGTERIMLRFGSPEELGYAEDFPISIIKISPKAAKFADKLTHRDFLGALLNLGIERRALGDIAIIDNVGYLFIKTDMAEYVLDSLSRVKRTDVNAELVSELPDGELYRTERRRIQAAGERLDAVVAKVFSLSREEALGYFQKRLVFVDGRLTENNSYTPKPDERISVRGLGRFIYCGYSSLSKKGKLNIDVDVYI